VLGIFFTDGPIVLAENLPRAIGSRDTHYVGVQPFDPLLNTVQLPLVQCSLARFEVALLPGACVQPLAAVK
jgi:hypothetical protein